MPLINENICFKGHHPTSLLPPQMLLNCFANNLIKKLTEEAHDNKLSKKLNIVKLSWSVHNWCLSFYSFHAFPKWYNKAIFHLLISTSLLDFLKLKHLIYAFICHILHFILPNITLPNQILNLKMPTIMLVSVTYNHRAMTATGIKPLQATIQICY